MKTLLIRNATCVATFDEARHEWQDASVLETWLRTERLLPKAQRRTARRLFEGLQAEGYRGAYDSVQRFVQRWKAAQSGPSLTQAYVPLAFAPGEVCQFDWSHEDVEIAGKPMLRHLTDSLAILNPARTVVVVGALKEQVEAEVADAVAGLFSEARSGVRRRRAVGLRGGDGGNLGRAEISRDRNDPAG